MFHNKSQYKSHNSGFKSTNQAPHKFHKSSPTSKNLQISLTNLGASKQYAKFLCISPCITKKNNLHVFISGSRRINFFLNRPWFNEPSVFKMGSSKTFYLGTSCLAQVHWSNFLMDRSKNKYWIIEIVSCFLKNMKHLSSIIYEKSQLKFT